MEDCTFQIAACERLAAEPQLALYLDDAVKLRLQGDLLVAWQASEQDPLELELRQGDACIVWKQLEEAI